MKLTEADLYCPPKKKTNPLNPSKVLSMVAFSRTTATAGKSSSKMAKVGAAGTSLGHTSIGSSSSKMPANLGPASKGTVQHAKSRLSIVEVLD